MRVPRPEVASVGSTDPWALALELGRQGLGRTAPNPPVGAVVVKDGQVVGRGTHRRAGMPHAEVEALAEAGEAARGATLYVTLEPCAHHGRTPPCTEAILAAGVARVEFGVIDPNPRVFGAGMRRLTEAGVPCTPATGAVAQACRELIRFYARHVTTGLPYVLYKYAMSLDGAVAAGPGLPLHLTCPETDRQVHLLRNQMDAVMVGIGTILADNPRLTARLPGTRDPVRVVVDPHLRLWPGARVLEAGSPAPTWVAAVDPAPRARRRALEAAGAEVLQLPAAPGGLDLHALLSLLGSRGVTSVLLEGGPTLAAAMLEQEAVQEIWAYLTPRLVGQAGGAGAARAPFGTLLPPLGELQVERVGQDLKVTARLAAVREAVRQANSPELGPV
jgi:diaminohydroxyphosphoribosylaminopyrimidine deaminase/5-amino-6-(5-phosphoribosylamino)uracil reductase